MAFLLLVICYDGRISTVFAFFVGGKSHHRPFFEERRRDQVILALTAVEQLDPVTGDIIQSFESIAEASRETGIHKVNIGKAVSGKRRQAGNYLWRRKGDKEIPELFEKPPTSVNVPVKQLDPVTGEVIQSFESIAEASRQTGITKQSIAFAVNGGRQRHAGKFLWRRQGESAVPELFESTPSSRYVAVVIEQLDPVSGKVVQSFESISEASQQTGIGRSSIRSALNGKYRHAGSFLWRKQGDKAVPNLFEGAPNTSSTKQVPVEQLDPVSGKVIQTFDSIEEASRETGISNDGIQNALRGKQRHAGKFLWRRKGNQSATDLFDSPPTSHNKPVPIEQLDPVTGEVIQSFKSIGEAERQTGIASAGICNVLNGGQRHAGTYLWRRQGDPRTPELFESPPTHRTAQHTVPIEQLDPFSGKVIRSFESRIEASRETGITYGTISRVLNGITLHAGTYLWRRKYSETAPELFENPSLQDNGTEPVAVEQLDPYSGQVIQRFDSIEQASQKSKIPIVDIHKVLSGKRRHAGTFLWRRQGDETSPELFERISSQGKPQPVEQLDPCSGEVIQSFKSIREAARQTGIGASTICLAVDGKARYAGNFLWRRKDD